MTAIGCWLVGFLVIILLGKFYCTVTDRGFVNEGPCTPRQPSQLLLTFVLPRVNLCADAAGDASVPLRNDN